MGCICASLRYLCSLNDSIILPEHHWFFYKSSKLTKDIICNVWPLLSDLIYGNQVIYFVKKSFLQGGWYMPAHLVGAVFSGRSSIWMEMLSERNMRCEYLFICFTHSMYTPWSIFDGPVVEPFSFLPLYQMKHNCPRLNFMSLSMQLYTLFSTPSGVSNQNQFQILLSR
jgi:hypothetical protein